MRYRKQFLGDAKIFKGAKLNKSASLPNFIFARQLFKCIY